MIHNFIFKLFTTLIIFLFTAINLFGQENIKELKQGNEQYAKKDYRKAEDKYRVSSSKSVDKTISDYNLGNSIYKQDNYKESKVFYSQAIETATTKDQKHKIFHNLGNIYMKEKDYAKAVESFKNALRNNPLDEQTRYNYALAKEMLKKNPPKDDNKDGGGGQDQNQDKNQNQDQNQNKENQKSGDNQDDKNNDKSDKDQGDNKNNDNKKDQKGDSSNDKNQQPPQQKEGGMARQRANNLLDAVDNEEKKVQGKVQQKRENSNKKGEVIQPDKNW